MGEAVEVDGDAGAGGEEAAEAALRGSGARLQLGEHHPAGEPLHVFLLLFPGRDVLVLGAKRGPRNGSGGPPCLCDAK